MSDQKTLLHQIQDVAIIPQQTKANSFFLKVALGIAVAAIGIPIIFKLIKSFTKKKISKKTFRIIDIYENINQKYHYAPIIKLQTQQITRIQGLRYSYDVALSKNLALKPIQNKGNISQQPKKKNPFQLPLEQGIEVMELGLAHRLLFNKFAFYKYHMLVVSKQSEKQTQILKEQDFLQTLLVTKALNGFYFFNSGEHSGASQLHKHLQIMPQQAKQLLIIENLQTFAQKQVGLNNINKQFLFQPFKFQHGMIAFKSDLGLEELATKTHKAYLSLHKKFIQTNKQNIYISYNLIGNQSFILLVPRRKQKAFELASLNGVAFAGSVLTKTKEQYNQLCQFTPQQTLNDVTFDSFKQLDDYKKQMIV